MKKAEMTREELLLALTTLELAFLKMKNVEALAIYNLEKKNLKKQNNSAVYIALDGVEINWFWTPKQVGWFDDMWAGGVSLPEMAVELNRKPLETALLVMDRELKKKIKPRKNGIWG